MDRELLQSLDSQVGLHHVHPGAPRLLSSLWLLRAGLLCHTTSGCPQEVDDTAQAQVAYSHLQTFEDQRAEPIHSARLLEGQRRCCTLLRCQVQEAIETFGHQLRCLDLARSLRSRSTLSNTSSCTPVALGPRQDDGELLQHQTGRHCAEVVVPRRHVHHCSPTIAVATCR